MVHSPHTLLTLSSYPSLSCLTQHGPLSSYSPYTLLIPLTLLPNPAWSTLLILSLHSPHTPHSPYTLLIPLTLLPNPAWSTLLIPSLHSPPYPSLSCLTQHGPREQTLGLKAGCGLEERFGAVITILDGADHTVHQGAV